MEKFILFDGQFYKENETFLTAKYLENKLFSVEMKLAKTKLLFWNEYQEIIALYLRLFGINFDFNIRYRNDIERQIQRTYVKNKLYMGLAVKLTFFWLDNRLTYMIELHDVKTTIFNSAPNDLELVVNDKLYKTKNILSSLKISNVDFWKMSTATCGISTNQLPIIMDIEKNILEVPNANIFIIQKDNKILTPSTSLAICVNPARQLMIDMLAEIGYKVEESKRMQLEIIRNADEVFVVNDMESVRSVLAFEDCRYFRQKSEYIREKFIERLVS